MNDIQNFETLLCEKLSDLGFLTELNFQIPTSGKLKWEVDIYIKSPVRAFVEIIFGKREAANNNSRDLYRRRLEKRAEMMRHISLRFKGAIIPILYTLPYTSSSDLGKSVV